MSRVLAGDVQHHSIEPYDTAPLSVVYLSGLTVVRISRCVRLTHTVFCYVVVSGVNDGDKVSVK